MYEDEIFRGEISDGDYSSLIGATLIFGMFFIPAILKASGSRFKYTFMYIIIITILYFLTKFQLQRKCNTTYKITKYGYIIMTMYDEIIYSIDISAISHLSDTDYIQINTNALKSPKRDWVKRDNIKKIHLIDGRSIKIYDDYINQHNETLSQILQFKYKLSYQYYNKFNWSSLIMFLTPIVIIIISAIWFK